MSALAILAGIFALSALAEGLVEYLIAPWLTPEGVTFEPAVARVRTMAVRYSAAAVGVLLCLAYRADVLALVGLESNWPFVGTVLTGLLIGRGSNYLHDFVSRWVRPAIDGGQS